MLSVFTTGFRPPPTVLNPVRGCFVELHEQAKLLVSYYNPLPPLSRFHLAWSILHFLCPQKYTEPPASVRCAPRKQRDERERSSRRVYT